jgi:hypothetical protein
VGGDAIQGDLDAIIFNPIASIILQLLRFKFVRYALLKGGFGLFMGCHHTPSLADVTVVTKARTLLFGKNDLKTLLASGIKDLRISFN